MDIVMCGVGGQGTVLASRVLGEAAVRLGFQVRTSEIIGMSRREGAVVSQVRIGHELDGPIIPDAAADFLLGFELAEAVRNIGKLGPAGKAVINIQKIIPPSVYLGKSSYNELALVEFLRQQYSEVILFDALDLARKAGNIKAVSAVMLGAFSVFNPQLGHNVLLEELVNRLPDRLKEINARAFNLGKAYIEEEMR